MLNIIYINKIEKYLLLALLSCAFAEGLFGPLYAIYVSELGGDIFDISFAWSSFLIVSGLLTILLGKLSDKHNKHLFLIYGFIITIISTFSYLLVSNPSHLFFVQIGLGIGSALIWPVWDTLYSKYQDKNEEGEEWGFVEGGWNIIAGISLLIGSIIIHHFGFHIIFIVMGSFFILGLIMILVTIDSIKKELNL